MDELTGQDDPRRHPGPENHMRTAVARRCRSEKRWGGKKSGCRKGKRMEEKKGRKGEYRKREIIGCERVGASVNVGEINAS